MSTIFSAYDIRGRLGDTLTAEQAWNVGKAFAEWLPDDGTIIVSRTMSADKTIHRAVIEGVLLQGRDVLDSGDDQKAVASAISEGKAVGGVLIDHENASELEVISLYDNTGASVIDKSGLLEVSALVDSGNLLPAAEKGNLIQG